MLAIDMAHAEADEYNAEVAVWLVRAERAEQLRHAARLTEMSETVGGYVDRYGESITPELAARIVRAHSLEPSEVLDETYWTGPLDSHGGYTRVHTAHLFLVLGY